MQDPTFNDCSFFFIIYFPNGKKDHEKCFAEMATIIRKHVQISQIWTNFLNFLCMLVLA